MDFFQNILKWRAIIKWYQSEKASKIEKKWAPIIKLELSKAEYPTQMHNLLCICLAQEI